MEENPSRSPGRQPEQHVSASKVECIALAGDLAHFSTVYIKWIPSLVELFLMRFYQLIDIIISCAKGRLVKLTGDGFLAVWELSGDPRENIDLCELVYRVASEASSYVAISGLDLKLKPATYLRQGIVIEPDALRLDITPAIAGTGVDYLGRFINLAFRIMNLPQEYPYVAAHEHFVEYRNLYGEPADPEFLPRTLSEDEISTGFKGERFGTDGVYVLRGVEQSYIDYIWKKFRDRSPEELQSEDVKTELVRSTNWWRSQHGRKERVVPAVVEFEAQLQDRVRNGPEWLRYSFVTRLAFQESVGCELVEMRRKLTKFFDEIDKRSNKGAPPS